MKKFVELNNKIQLFLKTHNTVFVLCDKNEERQHKFKIDNCCLDSKKFIYYWNESTGKYKNLGDLLNDNTFRISIISQYTEDDFCAKLFSMFTKLCIAQDTPSGSLKCFIPDKYTYSFVYKHR